MSGWPDWDALNQLERDTLGPLTPEQVLYEFDGPCIFTSRTKQHSLVLAYLAEELEEGLRYLVTTTSEVTVELLTRGAISVRDALERGSMWLVDVDVQGEPVRVAAIAHEQLPEELLPDSKTMLWASLESDLVVRLEGTEILPGSVPASVLTQAAHIGGTALKRLFEWAAGARLGSTSGRPREWLRALYALPTQRLSFGSLEVAFRDLTPTEAQGVLPMDMPSDGTASIREAAWSALAEGLAWSSDVEAESEFTEDTDKKLAVLEALKQMAPSLSGPVEAVEVSGRSFDEKGRSFRLSRASASKIRSELTRLKQRRDVTITVFQGRVRELDLDKLSFMLRDIVDGPDEVALLISDEDQLETARDAHFRQVDVRVAARSEDQKIWTASDIALVSEAP